jgi:hypothetical protein
MAHDPRLEELLSAPAPAAEEATALAATRAARLCWRAPPLGDATPPGPGGVLLAAAGAFAASPPLALALVEACPPPTGTWDLVLRDAVVGPLARAGLDETLSEALRARSPLTAVLDRPPPGGGDAAFALVEKLRRHDDGRRAIAGAFSTPGAPAAVRRFREGVMDRLRTSGDEAGADLVLQIYEGALVYHRGPTLAEVATAQASLSGREPGAGGEAEIDHALAVAGWWGPLWALRRSAPEALRRRPYLDVEGILEGTRLHGLARALSGGGAP